MKKSTILARLGILQGVAALLIAPVVLLISATPMAFESVAPSPPMGWNSWDAYGTTVREDQVKANADVMVRELLPFGWNYIVVDIEWYAPEAFHLAGVHLHCVSASQRGRCPPGARLVRDIENGIDLARFAPARNRRSFALALGRICPEKGFDYALRAAHSAGVPLLLAGRVFEYEVHRRYFTEQIAPLLDTKRRFIGPIGAARKRRLLGAARCVVIPSLAPETSSLVAMEALASGAPVLAYAAGALEDIVEHGHTGFIARSVDELSRALLRVGELRPEHCRASAERRFSARRMTAEYLELYEELARPQVSAQARASSEPRRR